MVLALLVGCTDLLLIRDAVEQFTNPLVVQAFYVGVEPLPEGVDFGEGPWSHGSTAEVLLADASDFEGAPIADAVVELEHPVGAITLVSEGDGRWSATAEDGLPWSAEAEVALGIATEGEGRIGLVTPQPPTVALPAVLSMGEGLEVDLDGQPYDNVLVTVIRLADGATVYDSTPTGISELYRLTHSASSLQASVPASAMSEPGFYAVGVSGLVNADPDDYEGVNLALSALTAGALRFTVIEVAP
jgi:hypothetical protein